MKHTCTMCFSSGCRVEWNRVDIPHSLRQPVPLSCRSDYHTSRSETCAQRRHSGSPSPPARLLIGPGYASLTLSTSYGGGGLRGGSPDGIGRLPPRPRPGLFSSIRAYGLTNEELAPLEEALAALVDVGCASVARVCAMTCSRCSSVIASPFASSGAWSAMIVLRPRLAGWSPKLGSRT